MSGAPLIALERSPSELNRGMDSRISFDLLEDCRRAQEAAGMALSVDLRERVVGAVEGGMSRNAAAKRFGVSIASAVRWVARFKAKGRDLAGSDGGRSSFRSYRGPLRLFARSHSPLAGHDAAGNTGTPDRQLRRAFLVLRALALFRSP